MPKGSVTILEARATEPTTDVSQTGRGWVGGRWVKVPKQKLSRDARVGGEETAPGCQGSRHFPLTCSRPAKLSWLEGKWTTGAERTAARASLPAARDGAGRGSHIHQVFSSTRQSAPVL